VSAHGSAATEDDSKKAASLSALNGVALAVLVLGVLGGVLLCLTEVSTVVEIRVGDVVRATEPGHEQHGWALFVLGVAALPLAWAAGVGGSRPAALALAAIGAVALVFWGVGDLPDTNETGEFGVRYEAASAAAGPGLWLELAGGIALVAAALCALPRRSPR
jgi:hypothetical protein